MNTYEFNITVTGTGEDVDAAFEDVLKSLKEDPMSAIKGEVVYVNKSDDEIECVKSVLDN